MFVRNGRTFPSDLVKFGSETLYLFLAEKNGRFLFCFVCFVCVFVATLSDFGFLFLKLEHSSNCEKAFKEKIIRFTVWELLNP